MSGAGCVFCQIVDGVLPAHEVMRDQVAVAFLDRSPVFHGHVLVVPIDHHETLADLPGPVVAPYFERVQLMSVVVESALPAAGTFVAINNRISQSVPHLHTHVVPRNRKDGLRGFFWPRTRYHSDAHMAEVASSLREAWNRSAPSGV